MKKILSLALSILLIVSIAACGSKSDPASLAGKNGGAKVNNPKIEISVKDYGKMQFELDPTQAPLTVANFMRLVNDGFYNGLTFHRIIKGFMVQGGDPLGTGYGGSETTIKGEFASNGVENNIKHERGVISMARSMNPDSASSQFFIMHEDSPHLDGEYAAFGMVTEGIEAVDRIAEVQTNMFTDAPVVPVVIKTMTVDTFGETYPEPKHM